MKRQIIYFSFIIFIISCSNIHKNEDKTREFFKNIIGEDTLTIQARFADCGEWGGHHERLDIYRKVDGNLWIHYLKDSVTCPDPTFFNRHLVNERNDKLTEEGQLAVYDFINEILDRSLNTDEGIGNAANSYIVTRKFDNLNIEYHNFNLNWTGFDKLKMKVNNRY